VIAGEHFIIVLEKITSSMNCKNPYFNKCEGKSIAWREDLAGKRGEDG